MLDVLRALQTEIADWRLTPQMMLIAVALGVTMLYGVFLALRLRKAPLRTRGRSANSLHRRARFAEAYLAVVAGVGLAAVAFPGPPGWEATLARFMEAWSWIFAVGVAAALSVRLLKIMTGAEPARAIAPKRATRPQPPRKSTSAKPAGKSVANSGAKPKPAAARVAEEAARVPALEMADAEPAALAADAPAAADQASAVSKRAKRRSQARSAAASL